MAKILLLGGSGIISSEITNLAIKKGHSVTMINRGKHKQFIHPAARCILADVKKEPMSILQQKISGKFDTVIDFIAYTPMQLKRNMDLARNHCSQYIFISSATVYNTKQGRYTENDPIGDSEWDYVVNKAACERYLIDNAQAYNFHYTIVRPYITYGKTRIPLQFAPLEYYTLIYRMKCHKCIPVFDGDIACTLTSSKDFAVAATGLIQCHKAFEEIFHVTGAYETTWNEVLKMEATAFHQECEMVPISKERFRNQKLMRGLNAIEVICDKSRNMLFDNSKIRSIVPEFTGQSTLENELQEIVAYFEENATSRTINHAWDARVDRMLTASGLLSTEQKKRLHFCRRKDSTIKDRLLYELNRHNATYMLYLYVRRVLHLAGCK